jgi:amino acid efflux transporter
MFCLLLVAVTGVGPRPSVLLTTSSFVLVYILGTAAAVKVLPRGGWPRRAAIIALVSVIVLLVITGPYVLWTLVVAAAALLYNRRRRLASDAADLQAPDESAVVQR